jgi:hypothetical protein
MTQTKFIYVVQYGKLPDVTISQKINFINPAFRAAWSSNCEATNHIFNCCIDLIVAYDLMLKYL